MRAHDNGSLFSVTISRQDIADFNERWPCSSIPEDKTIWAQFEKGNGDLVDLSCDDYGPELTALIQGGQNYAAKRLKLSPSAFRH